MATSKKTCIQPYCGNETLADLCDGHRLLGLEFHWQNRLFNWSIKKVYASFGGQEILPKRLNEMISQPIKLCTLAPVVRLDNRPFFYSEE